MFLRILFILSIVLSQAAQLGVQFLKKIILIAPLWEVRANMSQVSPPPPTEKLSLFGGEANSQFIVKVLILKLKYNVFQDKDDNQKSENSQSLCL